MIKKALFAMAAACVCTSAYAEAEKATRATGTDHACVFARTINDFTVVDRDELVIWAPGRRNAYLVKLSMPLPELELTHELAVIDRDGDGRLCGFGTDRIVVPDSSMPRDAIIMSMKRLEPEELAALEVQHGVKLTRKKPDAGAGELK